MNKIILSKAGSNKKTSGHVSKELGSIDVETIKLDKHIEDIKVPNKIILQKPINETVYDIVESVSNTDLGSVDVKVKNEKQSLNINIYDNSIINLKKLDDINVNF